MLLDDALGRSSRRRTSRGLGRRVGFLKKKRPVNSAAHLWPSTLATDLRGMFFNIPGRLSSEVSHCTIFSVLMSGLCELYLYLWRTLGSFRSLIRKEV